MAVKEQYKSNEAYVSFGPAALNKSIYRVEVSIFPENGRKPAAIANVAPRIVEGYKQQLRQGYGTDLETLETKKIKLNGNDVYYWKLKQDIPVGKHISNAKTVFNHYGPCKLNCVTAH